jgi:hypothetical protein
MIYNKYFTCKTCLSGIYMDLSIDPDPTTRAPAGLDPFSIQIRGSNSGIAEKLWAHLTGMTRETDYGVIHIKNTGRKSTAVALKGLEGLKVYACMGEGVDGICEEAWVDAWVWAVSLFQQEMRDGCERIQQDVQLDMRLQQWV